MTEVRVLAHGEAFPRAALKATLWLYFWLLLFEGVLRKWVLPEWSDALFLIRDPVAILAYGFAFRAGILRWRPVFAIIGLMTALSMIFSLAADTNILVTLFGLRTDFLHLPLIFVMAEILDRDDVVRYGRWFLLSSIPILLLMLKQFNASPDDILNAGVHGGAGGSLPEQLVGAAGRIRPPGPFSFISGVDDYFPFVTAFAFYGWLQGRIYSRLLVIVATLVTLLAIPVSISRSLLILDVIVVAFGLLAVARDPKRIPRFLGPAMAAAGLFVFAADTIYVQVFMERWNEAGGGAGGAYESIVGRIWDIIQQPFQIAADTPMMGYGIGMGTVAGAHLSNGSYDFILAESEMARCILELGPVLGFVFLGWRAWLALKTVWSGWRAYLEDADPLAWLIVGATFVNVIIGQWGQATTLGFSVFGAGLALAAAKKMELPEEEEPPEEEASYIPNEPGDEPSPS